MFVPDPNWREFGYFTANGASIKINMSGAWSCVIANQVIASGVKHFSTKIKRGTHILPAYVCEDELEQLNPIHNLESYNAYYAHDGTLRTRGIPRYSNRAINLN